jgi:anti-anti-sigma factor
MSTTEDFLTEEELPGGITKVCLRGRIDAIGAGAIDLRMNLIGGKSRRILIDLENVSYMASLGLRSIIVPARTLQGRGGKMVLFRPQKFVEEILKVSGVDTIIPIHHDLDAALAALQTVEA